VATERKGRDKMYKGERFNSISHLVGAVLAFAAERCVS
jgi:predicted membrane channel-forming protein YqfA (hemolysin III family)